MFESKQKSKATKSVTNAVLSAVGVRLERGGKISGWKNTTMFSFSPSSEKFHAIENHVGGVEGAVAKLRQSPNGFLKFHRHFLAHFRHAFTPR